MFLKKNTKSHHKRGGLSFGDGASQDITILLLLLYVHNETWFALATSVSLFMVAKKNSSDIN